MTEPAFDAHTLVLLRRPAIAPDLPDEELEALQEQHLAHLRAMREQGALAAAGPFRDQADETLRGLCLYRTGLEETRALAEQDPSVRAGRLRVDVVVWLVPAREVRLRDWGG